MTSNGIYVVFHIFSPVKSIWKPICSKIWEPFCSFPWFLPKLNFVCFPDVFIPSACQSGSRCPSCKPNGAFYNPVCNRHLEGKQCLTTPPRLEILLHPGTSLQVSGTRCPFDALCAADHNMACSLSSGVANGMTLGRDSSGAVSCQHTPLSLLAVCFIAVLKPDIFFRIKRGEREKKKKLSNSKDVKWGETGTSFCIAEGFVKITSH